MGKNILIITGSPRKGGNSEVLADAFAKGAQQAGHTVTKFEAAMKQIGGCKACNTCWSKGTACTFRDGFTELEPLLEQADMVVFATPVYWFTMSMQIKAAIDKFYAYMRPARQKELKVKEAVLLAAAGDTEEQVFDGLVGTYKLIMEYLKWKDAGILTVPGVYAKDDILKTDAPARAEALGKSI